VGQFSEKVASWYLRLNGFMTVDNFILHDEPSQRTDADIYGVRFPFRKELDMEDDALFRIQTKPLFVMAEVKGFGGECTLNGPWTNKTKQNMQYLLKAIGVFKLSEIDEAAEALYENCVYEDDERKVQLIVIGSRRNVSYDKERPELPQILFPDLLAFMHRRFREFRMLKSDHKQWDEVGRFLYKQSAQNRSEFNPSEYEAAFYRWRRSEQERAGHA
jgi:hypothetical protein